MVSWGGDRGTLMALRECRILGDHLSSVLALCNWKKTPPCAHTWGRGEQWGWRDISSWPQNLSVQAINVSEPQNFRGMEGGCRLQSGLGVGTGICRSGYAPDYTTGLSWSHWGSLGLIGA